MTGAEGAGATQDRIEWHYNIPLLTSRFMVWDFVRVTLISVAISYVLVALTGWLVDGEPVFLPAFVLLIVTGVVLALFAITCILLGNRHGAVFGVGPKGVTYAAGERERKINRIVAIGGALAGNPTTTGAGLIATGQEQLSLQWGDVHHVVYYPGPRVIVLRNTWRAVLRLHLTPELYEDVAARVDEYWRGAVPVREAALAGRRARAPWPYYTALVLAAALAGVGAQVWYWNDYEFSARVGAVGVVLLIAAVLAEGPARRISGFLSLPLIAWHLIAVVLSAMEVVDSVFGTFYVAGLDPAELALSVLSLVVLLGMATWRTFDLGSGSSATESR